MPDEITSSNNYVDCSSSELYRTLTHKWALPILLVLNDNSTLRNKELAQELSDISQKMLTQTLKELERIGLIQREVYPSVPLRVEYDLTPLGKSLLEPLAALIQWAEDHQAAIDQAINSYDNNNDE